MPGHPVTSYVVIAFLAMVVVLMGFMPNYRISLIVGAVWLAVLWFFDWLLTRRHGVRHISAE